MTLTLMVFILSKTLFTPFILAEVYSCNNFQGTAILECHSTEIKGFLQSWVNVWARGDLEAYLAHYVSNGSPKTGLSRDEWIAARKHRVSPEFEIEITLDLDSLGLDGADVVDVIFVQKYTSASYTDEVRKQLFLVRQEDGLKIRREYSLD